MPAENQRAELGARIRAVIRTLRDGKWLILACVLLATGTAILYSLQATPVYKATASLLVRQDDLNYTVGLPSSSSTDPEREAATDLELLSTVTLAQRVKRQLALRLSPEDILTKVETSAEGTSSVISITASDPVRVRSAQLANAFATQYILFRRDSDRRRYTEAIGLVERQIAQSEASGESDSRIGELRNQAAQLEQLRALQDGNAEVVQRAGVPVDRASPKPVTNALLGVLFGLMLGVALAMLKNVLDRRIKDEDQVRFLLPDVPIVASIPTSRGSVRDRRREVEGYRNLRTNLAFLDVNNSQRSLLITSATSGEGKSTTSLNLALAMTEADEEVLLIEADLRRPGLSHHFNLGGQPGVSNLLSGFGTLAEYTETVSVNGDSSASGPTTALAGEVSVLPAGPIPPNPQALLGGGGLDRLLSAAEKKADTVIVDGTPIGPLSDMLPLAQRVDGVILILRLYHTSRDELKRLKTRLTQASVEPIGVVVFGAPSAEADDYYLQ